MRRILRKLAKKKYLRQREHRTVLSRVDAALKAEQQERLTTIKRIDDDCRQGRTSAKVALSALLAQFHPDVANQVRGLSPSEAIYMLASSLNISIGFDRPMSQEEAYMQLYDAYFAALIKEYSYGDQKKSKREDAQIQG